MAPNRSNTFANVVTGTSSQSMEVPPINNAGGDSDTPLIDHQNEVISSNIHPLFLHNNDQPGMILISKKLLGSEDYCTWKRSMKIALSCKNKLVIATGEYKAPAEDSVLFPHWRKVNDMVITWILNTVSDEISNSMNYMDSAFDVWSELSERFSAVSGHKIYEVQKNMFRLEQGNDSVEIYFHKLKGFWEEIKALETPIKCTCTAAKDWDVRAEKTKLIQFLMGLHSSYTAARGHLLMMNPWPTLNQAYMLIKQEEKQRQVHSDSKSPIAMMVNLPKQSQASAGSYKSNDRGNLECTYCHGKNHVREKCYKLIGYPDKNKKKPFNKQSTSSNSQQQMNPQAMSVTSSCEDVTTSTSPNINN